MADQNLPDPTPAPNPAAPAPGSVPDPKPADDKPVVATPLTLDSFSDEEKKYLQSQGVTDLTSAEAIKKIINHAQSSQKTAADIKNQLDKVTGVLNPTPDPANPLVPATPPAPDQTQPNGNPAPAKGLDQVTAFTLSNQLATSFPLLKDDLVSGKLYQDMQALGIPLTTADGQVNLNGLINYSKREHETREMAAKLADAGKPGEGAIPDANATAPQQPASDAPMTKQMAQAIVLQDKTHARFPEAQKFLQDELRKK